MISRIIPRVYATLVPLLLCIGCAARQGESTGSRSGVENCRSGWNDTHPEMVAKEEAWDSPGGTTPRSDAPVRTAAETVATPAKTAGSPGQALADFGVNTFNGPWAVSRLRLGTDRPAFGKGDRVKLKLRPDGQTMTVEYVSPLVYVSGPFVPDASFFTIHYHCRWENKDGSNSVGSFPEDELELVTMIDAAERKSGR